MSGREATIVGAGVIGLTCAVRLQEAGFTVRIVAADPPAATTSAVAGALWMPYRAFPQDRVERWAARSRERFEELRRNEPAAGVGETEFLALLPGGARVPWWAEGLPPGDVRTAAAGDLPPGYGSGLFARVPLIEAPRYLAWLERRVHERGGLVERRRLGSLAEADDAPLVVNCAGVGAGALADDPTVAPARGQVVHVRPRRPVRAVVDDDGPNAVAYVLPRPDTVVCGGTVEPGDADRTPREQTTRDILRRCTAIEPALAGCEVLGSAAGLRPIRPAVRLEAEPRAGGEGAVIHCYGHGGAGFTLSWGCADEVAALAVG